MFWKIKNLIVEKNDVDKTTEKKIELWHPGDYVVLKSIIPHVVKVKKIHEGSVERTEKKWIGLHRTRVENKERTKEYPGDWDTVVLLLI